METRGTTPGSHPISLLPRITGRYRSPSFIPELGRRDPVDWTREQQREFDYQGAADECEITAADLARLYEHLVHRGEQIDPLHRWFALADQVREDRLEDLSGDALAAVDHYRAARVIRGWHSRLDDTEPLPDVNELRHGRAETHRINRRLYGVSEIRGNRGALPGILERLGLYPWRVQLFVEGPSEREILTVLLEEGYGTSFERMGIQLHSLGGAGIPKKTDRLLGAVRTYANYYLLIFDDEGTVPRLVDELRRAGHVDQDVEVRIWNESLEADNFTIPEICREVRRFAREEGVNSFRITTAEVRRSYEAGSKGLAEVVVKLAGERNVPLKKPDLARRLGQLALRRPELADTRRPILDVAEHLMRLAAASRRPPPQT